MPEGTPYHQPVAPVLPDAQHNKAPDLIFEGMKVALQGLATYGQINANRQRTELEMQQLAQNTALKQQEFGLKKLEFAQEYELQKGVADARIGLMGSQARAAEALATFRTNSAIDALDFGRKQAQTLDEARKEAREMRLFDPEFQTKDPVKFAEGVGKFKDHWESAPGTLGIGQEIGRLEKIRDSQTMKMFDKQMPIWRVAEGLQDESTHEIYKQELINSGLVTQDTEKTTYTKGLPSSKAEAFLHPADTLWNMYVGQKKTTKTPGAAKDAIKSWYGKKYDFTRDQSKVDPLGATSRNMYRSEILNSNSYDADGSAPLPQQMTDRELVEQFVRDFPDHPRAAAIRAKLGL